MKSRLFARTTPKVVFGWLLTVVASVHATEGGGTVYPNGADNFTAGAMPPAGTYGMLFATHYNATRVNDANGNDLRVPGFKVTANVLAPRFIWVTGAHVLGGDLSLHAIVPVVDLKVSVAGNSQHKDGLGDITTGPGIGYHHSPNLHSLLGVDFYLPTGGYDKNNLANIGRHYYAVEPLYIVSWIDPGGFNADIKSGIIVNRRNTATDYKSGEEFHFDYAAGWGIGNGLTVGAGGYYYKQLSDDKVAGANLPNSKASSFAIGPSVKYDSGKGWFVTGKWQFETNVKNRAQGNALWIKAVFPI